MQLRWVDICCGRGGASLPARDRGWATFGVDNESKFEPDLIEDIRNLGSPDPRLVADLLWISIPCVDFARKLLPWIRMEREPDLSLAWAAARLVAAQHPKPWAVECSMLSRKWLTPMFGPPRATVPGHAIWSNLAFLLPNLLPHKDSVVKGQRPRNPAVRAIVPYEIGEAICRAVEALGATAERADRR
jgi:hypothetical protein